MGSRSHTHRVAEARGCRRNWRQWVMGVASELEAIGLRDRAARLRDCGVKSLTYRCTCGTRHVHVPATCGLRVCPWCARRDSAERADRLACAVRLLAKEYPRLRWRFLTLTARWDPSDENSCSVAGLRDRVSDLWRRWRVVWKALRDHCRAAGAEVACEISDRGHVHLHALVLCRWIDPGWLSGVWGDYVDVRELRGGVREASKYVLKAPSPANLQWISGRHRKAIHWRLAARWEAATVGQHLRRCYGALRGLLDGELLTAPDTDCATVRHCSCGSPLPPMHLWAWEYTVLIARNAVRAKARIHWHFRPPDPP